MLRLLKKGDWGHSTFTAYLDTDQSLSLSSVNVTSAVSVCFKDKKHITLTRHKDGGYDLLGGKVEPGESFEDTLIREALEEAGVRLTSWKYFGYYDVRLKGNAPDKYKKKYPKRSYILFFISTGNKVAEPFGSEIKDCKTFSVTELKETKILDHEMLWEAIKIMENGAWNGTREVRKSLK